MPVLAKNPTRSRKSVKSSAGQPSARTALNMRIQPALRDMIDQAAAALGKNRTDFVLDAARHAASTALAEQAHFRLKPAAYAAFLKILDSPPRPNAQLRKVAKTPAPWE